MIYFIKHNDTAFEPLHEHDYHILRWPVKVNIRVKHRDNGLGMCIYKLEQR